MAHGPADQVAFQRLQNVITGDAVMIGVLHADPTGAESLGHVHSEAIGVRADNKAEAIVAIDGGGAGRGAQHFDLWPWIDAAQSEHVEITVQTGNAVRVNTAQVRGGEDFGGLGRIILGNTEMQKNAVAEIAQRFDGENFGLHFGHVFFAFSMRLRRQSLPAGFRAKRNQEQTDRKGDGGKSNRYSERLKMLNAGANQKSDPGSAKSAKGRGESEGAGATFGRILLRQPQRVNRKIRAANTEKEQADKEPRKSHRAKIKDLSKRERDEDRHHGKIKCESAAPAEFFREPGNREATKNVGESDEHGCGGCELLSLWPDSPVRLRER